MLRIPVLLVDDDYRVLEELKTIVDWKELGFKIAATASDGEKAFEMYKKHKPKLIVTDLYMPVMDGMDLVEQVRREDKDVCFLLISSYEDFQYAKRAMKANVEEYILKNELSREVLTEKLTQLRGVLMLENKNNVFTWRMSCTDYMNSMEGTENYLETHLYDPQYRERMKQVILRPCYYFLFYRQKTLAAKQKTPEQDMRLDLRHAYQICENMRDKYDIKVYFEYLDYLIVGLAASDQTGEPKNIGRNFLTRLKEEDGENLHCIYPERPATLEHLRVYLGERRQQFEFYRYFVKEDYISLQFFRYLKTVDTHFIFPYHLLDDKIFAEKELYCKAVTHHIDMLFANYDLAGVKRAFRNLLLRYEELSEHQLAYDGEYLFADAEELCDFLCREYERVTELKDARKTAEYSNVVRMAVDYLNERYGEADISVEDLADHVQLSTGRIAVLFKKETGQTVNDYLTDLRINQAIHLLTHSNLRIYEIASRVGYRTSQYFSKVFMKKTGRRPNEYR